MPAVSKRSPTVPDRRWQSPNPVFALRIDGTESHAELPDDQCHAAFSYARRHAFCPALRDVLSREIVLVFVLLCAHVLQRLPRRLAKRIQDEITLNLRTIRVETTTCTLRSHRDFDGAVWIASRPCAIADNTASSGFASLR